MNNFNFKFVIIAVLTAYSDGQCEPCNNKEEQDVRYVDIAYEESIEHIENPERGFMQYTISASSNLNPLTVERMNNWRTNDGITLVWRQWELDNFVTSDISQEFLDHIQADFDVIREARFSAIVRFMYTDELQEEAPYGDADKTWMTRHIQQVRDVLHNNEDVIVTVQAGFIGTWGEWYYTTYFGDPDHMDCSKPENVRCLTPQNWQDRHDILNELLASASPNVTVAIRYPQTKYYLLDDEDPTTEEDMKNLTKKYRISHHNDCFLSSPNDVGTYVDFEKEYPYLQADLQYSNVGGETCKKDTETFRHVCSNALVEMRELHYTYLNQAYNQEVLDEWIQDGCYESIHRDMGYRLVLRSATLPESVTSGETFCFSIVLQNIGYAAPVKNRDVEIVFRNTESGQLFSAGIPGIDIRTLLSGTIVTINDGVTVPLNPGNYEVLLAIKPHSSFLLSSLSDYNILTANFYTPEYKAGLNNLLHTVEVLSSVKPATEMVCPPLVDMPAQEQSPYERRYCGWGECTGNSQCTDFTIQNPSFEETDGWVPYGTNGFAYTTEEASNGVQSIRISDGGAQQLFSFPAGTRQFSVSADSMNEGITAGLTDDYSIYCDVKLADESWMYGETAQFTVRSPNWHSVTLQVSASQDIVEGWCYAMFRNYDVGTAWFDNFRVQICD